MQKVKQQKSTFSSKVAQQTDFSQLSTTLKLSESLQSIASLISPQLVSSSQYIGTAATLKRAPIQGLNFNRVIDEFLERSIDIKSNFDSEIICRLLQIDQKTKQEISALDHAFGNLKFFREAKEYLQRKQLENLFCEVKYQHFSKYQNIFELDEIGEKFYIIIKGSVLVLVPNNDFDINAHRQAQTPRAINNTVQATTVPKVAILSFTHPRKFSVKVQNSDEESPGSGIQSARNTARQKELQQEQIINIIGLRELNKSQSLQTNKENMINTHSEQSSYRESPRGSQTSSHKGYPQLSFSSSLQQCEALYGISQTRWERQAVLKNAIELQSMAQELTIPIPTHVTTEDLCHINNSEIEETIKIKNPQLDIIRELVAGDAFGEIALLNHSRRTASIACKEDTVCAVLSKQSYDKILAQYHIANRLKNISFLKEFSIFKGLSNRQLDAIFILMKTLTFSMHQIIYAEGDSSDFLYFIRSGEVEISQYQKKRTSEEQGEKQEDLKGKVIKQKVRSSYREPKKRIKIAILGANNYFGQEELFSRSSRQYQATTCSHEIVVYAIHNQKFLGICRQFNQSMRSIEREFSKQSTWRVEQLSKNSSTVQKIKIVGDNVNREISKLKNTEDIIKQIPPLIQTSLLQTNFLDRIKNDFQEQEEVKSGLIRYQKDFSVIHQGHSSKINNSVNKLCSKVDGKSPFSRHLSSSQNQEHLGFQKQYSLSLENNLFPELTDKITKRMKKEWLHPLHKPTKKENGQQSLHVPTQSTPEALRSSSLQQERVRRSDGTNKTISNFREQFLHDLMNPKMINAQFEQENTNKIYFKSSNCLINQHNQSGESKLLTNPSISFNKYQQYQSYATSFTCKSEETSSVALETGVNPHSSMMEVNSQRHQQRKSKGPFRTSITLLPFMLLDQKDKEINTTQQPNYLNKNETFLPLSQQTNLSQFFSHPSSPKSSQPNQFSQQTISSIQYPTSPKQQQCRIQLRFKQKQFKHQSEPRLQESNQYVTFPICEKDSPLIQTPTQSSQGLSLFKKEIDLRNSNLYSADVVISPKVYSQYKEKQTNNKRHNNKNMQSLHSSDLLFRPTKSSISIHQPTELSDQAQLEEKKQLDNCPFFLQTGNLQHQVRRASINKLSNSNPSLISSQTPQVNFHMQRLRNIKHNSSQAFLYPHSTSTITVQNKITNDQHECFNQVE